LHCDLFVLTHLGLEFYKIVDVPLKASGVKSYQLSVSKFWFDCDDGILLISTGKSLEILPFFMCQTRGPKYFQGSTLVLQQKYIENDFLSSLHGQDLSTCSITPLDKIQILVSKIYECSHLLCLDGLQGTLHVYKIESEFPIYLLLTVNLRPGGYTLRVQNNLLILHNYGPQESYIYDIKKDARPEESFVLVKHRGSTNPEYNLHQVLFHTEIDPHCIIIGKEFYVDVINGKLFVLKTEPFLLVENYPNVIESILFLLRRDKSLVEALLMIKKCLVNKVDLLKLTQFFNVTNYCYKQTAMMRKQKRKPEDQVNKSKKGSEINNQSEKKVLQLKSETGMTILLQSDIFLKVFKPFYKEVKDYEYLSKVLIAYIYSLVAQDLHVHVSHQHLLVKTLIKLKNFRLIQHLIQYQLIANNIDIALLLTTLEGTQEKYSELFQIGVDMMYRLKSFVNLVKILAQRGDLYEALNIVLNHEENYDLNHFTEYSKGSDLESVIKEVIRDLELKNKV
jgi:Colon cancer-associated protein Mic1-like